MGGPWEKYQAPAAEGPWAKYQPAAAAPPTAANPADVPNLAPPAPGVNLYQNGNLATPAAAAPPPPQDPMRGTNLTLQALNKGAIADTLGIPVDLTTGALNAGSALVNMGAQALGHEGDVTGYVHDPVGGSQSLSNIGGAAYQAATGKEAISPETMTPDELARYRMLELGANAATTEGFGQVFSKLAGVSRAADVAPPTSSVEVFKPVDRAPTPASIGSAAAAGAGAGAAQQAYDQYGHPIVKNVPLVGPALDTFLDTASTLAGAVGGHALGKTAVGAAKVASIPARAAVKPFTNDTGGFTLTDGTRAAPKDLNVAADTYQTAAINPTKAAGTIASTTNTMRSAGPVVPTTGAMSADPGLVSLEQRLRMDPTVNRQFVRNDQQVQQAARTDVDAIAPSEASGRAFTDTANDMQAKRVAGAQANVTDTSRQIDDLERQRLADANPVAAARNTQVPASQALDKTIVDKTLVPMQEKNAAMYSAVDPERAAAVSSDPLIEAATAVRNTLGDFNSPEKVLPAGLLRRIEGTAGEVTPEVPASTANTGLLDASGKPITRTKPGSPATQEPSVTSIGDIVSVYPELATTEQRARRAGNFTLADNIRGLRHRFDDTIEDAAAAGDPAAQAAMEAKQNYANTIGKTFNDGPGGPATKLRKDFNVDKFQRSESEPSQTAGRFLQPGQPEKAQSLKTILDASPEKPAGQRAAGQYLTADLAASGAVDAKGRLNPQAIANWRAKWGEDTLATAPDFKAQLDQLEAGAKSGTARAGQLEQQLKAHQTALKEVEANNTAFRHVVGKDPTAAVASLFKSDDPERALHEIMGQIGKGTAAHDGLKAAVREYLIEDATTSALQKTTTGTNPLSFAKLDTLFKQREKAMAEVFSADEMHSLQVAHQRLKAINNLAQQTLPGSPTAERDNLAKKLWTSVEIVLKSLYGGLEGGNKVRNLKLAAAMQGGGPNAVYKLLVEAQFNPELAQVLAKREVGGKGRKNYDAKLFNRIVLPGAVTRNNLENQQEKQE